MDNKNIWQIRYEKLVEVMQGIALKEMIDGKVSPVQYRYACDIVAEAFLRAEGEYKKEGYADEL